jgi:DNA-binding cell septation regulator SpoVG
MHINVEMHGDQFNVQVSSKAGEDHFLAIKGCRIVSGSNGEFVSFPARKMDSGKYWTHVWASDKFQAAILKAHAAAAKAEAKAPAKKAGKKAADDWDDEIPF